MTLPTREEFLSHVEFRFRELAPDAPVRLDPNDLSHQTMIRQWHEAHREVLSKMTDEAFFSFFPQAPAQLDPANSDHATHIEYWKDIASQINSGRPGRYDWSQAVVAQASAATAVEEEPHEEEQIEIPLQDGSVRFEERIGNIRMLMDLYAEAVAATPLAAELTSHTWTQVDALRGLVRDGTFQTYDHWWRSASYSKVIYDEQDRTEELAFVRDLTLEAKIDRETGALDVHLAGWATDFRKHNTFGRVSMANA
jgi:hypothetical protein